MGNTPVTRRAADCADCGLVTVPKGDVGAVLDRLPPALWNRARPTEEGVPPLLGGDTADDTTIFGPTGSDDRTPQYALAEFIATEKDRFLLSWRTAESQQLGLGRMTVSDVGVSGESPRAAGADLDRVGSQYGVGRPHGFTDCCYWRLVQLLLFTPGPGTWRLRELAELYTGIRPAVMEAPSRIALVWPTTADDATYYSDVDEPPADGQGAYDANGIYFGDATPPEPGAGVWADVDTPPGDDDSAWTATEDADAAIGLGLLQALQLAKSAGTFIELINPPPLGASGCLGATVRGPQLGSSMWALAEGGLDG